MRKAFPGSGPEVAERYERSGKWLLAALYGSKDARDWCDRKGVKIVKATGEGIGSAGGFLVPHELERAILDLRDTFGAFRRRACVWPMGSDSSLFRDAPARPRPLSSAKASRPARSQPTATACS
jgi:HK97 family phage major capsid protein